MVRFFGSLLIVVAFSAAYTGSLCSANESFVRVIYLSPSDKSYNHFYAEKLQDAALDLQNWFETELGGPTLSFHPWVEWYQTTNPSSWYQGDPNTTEPDVVGFWNSVTSDAFSLTGGNFNDPNNRWLIYIDADPAAGQLGGAGTSGVAMMSANDLRGLAGEDLVANNPGESTHNPGYDRWVGGMGHELGHALGLPHPPGSPGGPYDDSLMYAGLYSFPDTYLRSEEKTHVLESGFATRATLTITDKRVARSDVVVGGFERGGTGTINLNERASRLEAIRLSIKQHGLVNMSEGSMRVVELKVDNGGELQWTGGGILINGGVFDNGGGSLTLNGADNPNLVLSNGGSATQTRVQIGATDRGTVTLEDVGAGGFLTADSVSVGSQGSLRVRNGAVQSNNLTIAPGGGLQWSGGAIAINRGVFDNGGGSLTLNGPNNPNLVLSNGGSATQTQVQIGTTERGTVTLEDVGTGGFLNADSVSVGPQGSLRVRNGAVQANNLTIAPGGSLQWSGGAINLSSITGDATQEGGILSPSTFLGNVTVAGNYTLQDGLIGVTLLGQSGGEAASSNAYEILGDMHLNGGGISVRLSDGELQNGDVFRFVDVMETLTGTFDGLSEGDQVADFGPLHLLITYTAGDGNDIALYTAPALPGDYNADGRVNVADYAVWRNNLGSTGLLAYSEADGSGDGIIGHDDYLVWKQHFGTGAPPVDINPIPEPGATGLWVVGLLLFLPVWQAMPKTDLKRNCRQRNRTLERAGTTKQFPKPYRGVKHLLLRRTDRAVRQTRILERNFGYENATVAKSNLAILGSSSIGLACVVSAFSAYFHLERGCCARDSSQSS